jgi:hypothetical protein
MSRKDYERAKELGIQPTNVLVMALLNNFGDPDVIRDAFPDIFEEWSYRHWSGGGLMPGEDGYNPAYDDNLLVEGK